MVYKKIKKKKSTQENCAWKSEPKKKKKGLGTQQNITTLSQYLYFQQWWISI